MSFLLGLAAPLAFAASAATTPTPPPAHRMVVKQVVVPADANAAWALWTTNEGFQSFFPGSPGFTTNIKLEPGGPYEVFLIAKAPEGSRGCDGCRILGYQEGRMLSFTWTNRPDMAVRPHRTHVALTFEPLSPRETRVTLVQDGWGSGSDWDVAYAYFDRAWGHVLDAYAKRISTACPAARTADICQLSPR
jgi:uncharacterized protein YndB with AHSA1/START domain